MEQILNQVTVVEFTRAQSELFLELCGGRLPETPCYKTIDKSVYVFEGNAAGNIRCSDGSYLTVKKDSAAILDSEQEWTLDAKFDLKPLPQRFVEALAQPQKAKKFSSSKLADALQYLDSDDRDTWIKVGQALKNDGEHNRQLFIDWSKLSPKSQHEDLEARWNSFLTDFAGRKIGLGSIFHLAKENGWKPAQPIVNHRREGTGDDIKIIALTLNEILECIESAGLMPNRVGTELFTNDLRFLQDKDDLFAWFKSQTEVRWANLKGCQVNQQELYRQLQYVAPSYDAISTLPHSPRVPGLFYFHAEYQPGNKLEQFLDFFCPETPHDRQLIKAALLTLFWGGPPGMRPSFTIIADSGPGSGKTAMAEAFANIANGYVKISSTDTEKLTTRLLSATARDKRIVFIDNLKCKMDWDGAEQLITAATISGHRLYSGEGQTPNLFTWFITVNGVSLSTDMAQRTIVIKLARPQNDPQWWTRLLEFIELNRESIIGDILATLEGPRNYIGPCSRWATWEGEILSLLEYPQELQQLILERQGLANGDAEDARNVEAAIADAIDNAGGDSELCYRLSGQDVATIYNATLDSNLTRTGATQVIKRKINEGQFTRLTIDPSRTHGRGYIWNRQELNQVASNELLNRLNTSPVWR